MANTQQIALNLVAQLDQGNIQSQASQMASTMATAIEAAFEGLGQKIAASIISGVKGGLSGSIELVGAHPGAALSHTERQLLSTQTAQTGLMPPMAPQPNIPTYAPGTVGGLGMNIDPRTGAVGPGTATGTDPRTEGGFLGFDRKQIGKLLGALGTGLDMAGELPGALRRGEGAGAETGNFAGRSLMRGDVEGVLAQDRLGGQEAIRGRAAREEGMKIAGEIALGVAALIAAPFTGGASMAVAVGGVGLAAKGIMGAAGFESNVLSNMQDQVESERQRSAEFLKTTERGRAVAIGGFRASQQLGAQEFAPMVAGGQFRDFAINRAGLSETQLTQGLTGFAGMGGIVNGQPGIMQGQGPQAIQRLLEQMGQGFVGAPSAAGGLVQGGMGQVQALETTAQMFEDAVAAGLDKAKTGDAIVRMGERAASLGLGGGAVAQQQTNAALGMAQGLFGGQGGPIQDAQQKFAEQITQFYSRGAERGVDLLSNLQGIRSAEQKMGVHLSGKHREEFEFLTARQTVTAEGLKMFEQRLSPGERKQFEGREQAIAEEMEARKRLNKVTMLDSLTPMADLGDVVRTTAVGAPLDQAMLVGQARDQIRQTGGRLPAGVPLGTGQIADPGAMREQAQMRETAIQTAASDALIVSKGLGTLAQQLPALNTAFSNLLASVNQSFPKAIGTQGKPGDQPFTMKGGFFDMVFGTAPHGQ